MAATLQYLTVQDVLWINLEATRRRYPFSYATLEEATYYQYAYGESQSLLPQAARFVSGFLRLRPFEAGNHATAFIGVLAFIRANGHVVELDDETAIGWFDHASLSRQNALDALQKTASRIDLHADHSEAPPDSRGFVRKTMSDFPETIRTLAARG